MTVSRLGKTSSVRHITDSAEGREEIDRHLHVETSQGHIKLTARVLDLHLYSWFGSTDAAACVSCKAAENAVNTVRFRMPLRRVSWWWDWSAGHEVEVVNNSGQPDAVRPFRITFPPPPAKETGKGKKRKADDSSELAKQPAARPKLVAESYSPPNPGPYPQDKPPENPVRFTPVQVTLPSPTSLHVPCGKGNCSSLSSVWLRASVGNCVLLSTQIDCMDTRKEANVHHADFDH